MLMQILVTGGAGYLGSILCKKLLDLNHKVICYDTCLYGMDGILDLVSNKNFTLLDRDIRNLFDMAQALKNIDAIVHLASIVGMPASNLDPESSFEINYLATEILAKMAKNRGVKQFIFASSCSVYGSQPDKMITEKSEIKPLDRYAKHKYDSEDTIRHEFPFPTILRFGTLFGYSPRMRFDLLLHEFIRDAVVDKKIILFGSNYWRPLVHLNDISQACILALQKPLELISGEIFNVGSNDQNYTKINIAHMVQIFFKDTKIEIINSKKDPRNYRVSFDKSKNKLGFSNTMTLTDGIQEIANAINEGCLDPRDSDFTNTSSQTKNLLLKN